MIELRRVVKTFGHRMVLRSVDLTINEGEFVTLMGPNGAGKTTLLHLIASLSKPLTGSIHINGYNLAESASQLRRFIGLVSHKTLLYDDLTAEQNLQFYARMYDVAAPDERIGLLLEQVGLWGRHRDPVRTFSRGMQQRLSIARAMLHNPPILLLDEPDTGLDQRATRTLGELLTTISGSQRTVLMTTHHLDWGVAMGQRLLILAQGKICYDVQRKAITSTELQRQYEKLTRN